jgi:hypothetical protein
VTDQDWLDDMRRGVRTIMLRPQTYRVTTMPIGPALDAYLTAMGEAGWSVVSVAPVDARQMMTAHFLRYPPK